MSHLPVSRWGDSRGVRSEHSRAEELDLVRPWSRRDAAWADWYEADDRLLWSAGEAWEGVEDQPTIQVVRGWSAWALARWRASSDGASWREALSRYSGTIEALDRMSRSLVIGEAGGGGKEEGAPLTRRYNITVTSSTAWLRIRGTKRTRLSGWPAESMELLILPWQAEVGDGVSVHARSQGRSLVAVKITVIPPER